MALELKVGSTYKSTKGVNFKILKLLGGGGQGNVYLIDYNGQKKAFKHYTCTFNAKEKFIANLKNNIQRGAPNKAFIWPLDFVADCDDSFGYIMDLRPEGYYEISDFMLARAKFTSFKTIVDSCLKIVTAFRALHAIGYSYQDLNDGNFFINPTNGDVLICDNDNVAPDGTNMGVIGKPRYLAPEIVVGNGAVLPNVRTDLFSLSIILFLVLCMNHPLEGKRWVEAPCMVSPYTDRIYGSQALFIFDPNDKSNEIPKNVKGLGNALKRWPYLPPYIKDIFLKAFSQETIKNPNRRLREIEWLKALVRFRSEIIKCSCGNEVFMNESNTVKCDGCGKPHKTANLLKVPEYSFIATRGTRLYRCQLGMCNVDHALDPIALIVAKPDNPNVLGLKNVTTLTLKAYTPSGVVKLVKPQEIIPVKSGIKVEVYDSKLEII